MTIGEIVTLIVSSIVAIVAAWLFGDVAGSRAAIRFAEKEAAKARIGALKALLNEITMIYTCARANSSLTVKHGDNSIYRVLEMPVAAFEMAFLTGQSNLLDHESSNSSEPLVSVTIYLAEARFINRLVALYSELTAATDNTAMGQKYDILTEIRSRSSELSSVLDQIKDHLKSQLESELEKLQRQRSKMGRIKRW